MNDIETRAAVILDTKNSPYATIRPISINSITLEDGFWKSKLFLNQTITIPTQYQLLESTGRLDNFRRLTNTVQKEYQGYVFNDSDVYKWLEAASWTIGYTQDEAVALRVDEVIELLATAQDNDGYLNTYFSLDRISDRWKNLREKHELYCAGHLIQAAIAHYRSTGKDNLLGIAIRFSDHIYQTFGPGKLPGVPGHPEIEMALIELYRLTSKAKYLELAEQFINRRGNGLLGGSEYLLDHQPYRELERLTGHAVRALYLCCGATDLYLEIGESNLLKAIQRLWANLTEKQMYITGGVGSRYDGEAIGVPYELPNARAYAETCAAIANVMWNWRMFQISGEAIYTDLLEWTLYNAVLPGVSIDAQHYFYENTLDSDGSQARKSWFECACCPPNVSRTLAMFPGFIYSQSRDGVWVNLFVASMVQLNLDSGRSVLIKQQTDYPWDGRVRIEVVAGNTLFVEDANSFNPDVFSIFVRIPGWINEYLSEVKVNGESIGTNPKPGTYIEIKRTWKIGDFIEIHFPMEAKLIVAHPHVIENTGRAAVTRGPLVYCVENEDNPDTDLHNIMINTKNKLHSYYLADLLNGISIVDLPVYKSDTDLEWEGQLYKPLTLNKHGRRFTQVYLKSIPYFAWGNRSAGQMVIWHRYK